MTNPELIDDSIFIDKLKVKLAQADIKRVCIIGSGGTGKTTLLNKLFEDPVIAEKFTKLDEQVRVLCKKYGYESPPDIPANHMAEFREELLDHQILVENEADRFIGDRGTIDCWTFYMRWAWNDVDVEVAERIYQKSMEQAKKYDLIVFMPIRFKQVDDGFRWVNATYQAQIDRMMKSILRDWELDSKLISPS